MTEINSSNIVPSSKPLEHCQDFKLAEQVFYRKSQLWAVVPQFVLDFYQSDLMVNGVYVKREEIKTAYHQYLEHLAKEGQPYFLHTFEQTMGILLEAGGFIAINSEPDKDSFSEFVVVDLPEEVFDNIKLTVDTFEFLGKLPRNIPMSYADAQAIADSHFSACPSIHENVYKMLLKLYSIGIIKNKIPAPEQPECAPCDCLIDTPDNPMNYRKTTLSQSARQALPEAVVVFYDSLLSVTVTTRARLEKKLKQFLACNPNLYMPKEFTVSAAVDTLIFADNAFKAMGRSYPETEVATQATESSKAKPDHLRSKYGVWSLNHGLHNNGEFVDTYEEAVKIADKTCKDLESTPVYIIKQVEKFRPVVEAVRTTLD